MAEIKLTDGSVLQIRLTLGSLRRFEQRAGLKFFTLLHRLTKEAPKDETPMDLGIRVFSTIFQSLDDAAAFIYECAVFPANKPKYEDFCETLSAKALPAIFSAIVEEIADFLPETEPGEGEGAQKSGPLSLSGGETSTKPQG